MAFYSKLLIFVAFETKFSHLLRQVIDNKPFTLSLTYLIASMLIILTIRTLFEL